MRTLIFITTLLLTISVNALDKKPSKLVKKTIVLKHLTDWKQSHKAILIIRDNKRIKTFKC